MAVVRILGLDPGLARMGWGVIACEGTRLTHVAHGVIQTRASEGLGLRLLALHTHVTHIIAEFSPGAIAIEQAFVAKDPSAARAVATRVTSPVNGGGKGRRYSPNFAIRASDSS